MAIRKIFIALSLLFALNVNAQEHFTLWYGINHAGETHNSYNKDDNRFKFANFGLDYTDNIAGKWDWTAGLGYNSKGVDYQANYIQAEGNAGYRLIDINKSRLSVFTGPYVGIKVRDNAHDWLGGSPVEYNTFSCGWQAGLGFIYSCLAFKISYEHAFTNIDSDLAYSHKTYQWFARIGVRF